MAAPQPSPEERAAADAAERRLARHYAMRIFGVMAAAFIIAILAFTTIYHLAVQAQH
jgi:hypothetical protein